MASPKDIWSDPVWSKVIAGAILAVAGVIITYFLDWWPAIGVATSGLFTYLGESSSIPNWIIGVGATCSLLVAFVVAAIIWQIIFPSATDSEPSSRTYISDQFYGLRWHWQYSSSGDIYPLYPCCANCDYQVQPENVSGYSAVLQIQYRCDLCGKEVGPFDIDPDQIENRVERMIQQKLRTGSWHQKAS